MSDTIHHPQPEDQYQEEGVDPEQRHAPADSAKKSMASDETHDKAEKDELQQSREKIAEVRTTLEDKHGFLKPTPKNVMGSLSPYGRELLAQLLASIDQEFQEDPDLLVQCRKMFLENDQEYLRKKSVAQLQEMMTLYDGNQQPASFWQWRRKREQQEKQQEKKKHLETFRKFVDGLTPVRADSHKDLTVFKSPRAIGQHNSFGPKDVPVQADNYVYAGFPEIAHHMSLGGRRLDENELRDRAELVMNDAGFVWQRANNRNGKFMRTYLRNAFDYTTGKEILAAYLASVFASPEEAAAFVRCNNDPPSVQHWEEGGNRGFHNKEYTLRFPPERAAQIIARMKEIRDATGIEPPLSLEVRIRDHANVR